MGVQMLTDNADKQLTNEVIPEISSTHRFQWEEVQDCYVILYAEGMVKLSSSAAEILKRCDGEKNVRAIIEALQQQFPDSGLEQDVNQFLEVAHENGWIQYK